VIERPAGTRSTIRASAISELPRLVITTFQISELPGATEATDGVLLIARVLARATLAVADPSCEPSGSSGEFESPGVVGFRGAVVHL
jgi:hypothetical protein